jgi:histidine ammonia-lyase
MGYEAALRTRRSVALLGSVLAIELLAAAQGVEMRQPQQPGRATGAVIAALRAIVEPLSADRVLSGDVEAVAAWVRGSAWRDPLAAADVTLR